MQYSILAKALHFLQEGVQPRVGLPPRTQNHIPLPIYGMYITAQIPEVSAIAQSSMDHDFSRHKMMPVHGGLELVLPCMAIITAPNIGHLSCMVYLVGCVHSKIGFLHRIYINKFS